MWANGQDGPRRTGFNIERIIFGFVQKSNLLPMLTVLSRLGTLEACKSSLGDGHLFFSKSNVLDLYSILMLP